jgi:hypothetical protein
MADSSRKNHLAVLRSFFQTLSRRLEVPGASDWGPVDTIGRGVL